MDDLILLFGFLGGRMMCNMYGEHRERKFDALPATATCLSDESTLGGK